MAAKVKALQQWCKLQCEGYRDVNITNMTSSWKSGLAFCAIIHKYRPDLIDYDSLSKENVFENNKLAFNVAKQLGIPALLDAEDMVVMTVPDKLCIVTYVSQYYNYFRNYRPVTSVKRHLQEDISSSVTAKKPVLHTSVNQNSLQNQLGDNDKSSNDVTGSIKRHTMEDMCYACKNKVFLLERQIEGNKLYHRLCLRNMQKKQSSTLQLSCNTVVTVESKHGLLDQCKNMKCESMEKEDNLLEDRRYLLSVAPDENCSKVVETLSCTITTVCEKEPNASMVSLNDQHTSKVTSAETNFVFSITSTSAAGTPRSGVILDQFAPAVGVRQKMEFDECVKPVFNVIVTSVHSNDLSCGSMTLSSQRSEIVTNSFTHPKQSVTTCIGHVVDNSVNEMSYTSSRENISNLQHSSGLSVIRTNASLDTASDIPNQSNKIPVPMRPSVPPVSVFQSLSGSYVIPLKPPRSSVITNASHDAFNESSNLRTEQSIHSSYKLISFPSCSSKMPDSNQIFCQSVSSIEKQPTQIKNSLMQGTLLALTNSSSTAICDIPRASAVDDVLVISAAAPTFILPVLNQQEAETAIVTAGSATGQNLDVCLKKLYQSSPSVISPTQSIKTPISHPAKISFSTPSASPTVLKFCAPSTATSSLSESECMLSSSRSTKTSNFFGSASNSGKVEQLSSCLTIPSSSECSYKTMSFDKSQESGSENKMSLDGLPLELNRKNLNSIERENNKKPVIHSDNTQKNSPKRQSIVLINDDDEENCTSAKLQDIPNLKSEVESQSSTGNQQPSIPPRPGNIVSRNADGKDDLSLKNQEPAPKMNDGNSFGNKRPQIPKRPPSIVASKEIDSNNCMKALLHDVSNKKSQINPEYKENIHLYSIIEEGKMVMPEKVASLDIEKSKEFSLSSSSLVKDKIQQIDIKFRKNHQNDISAHADVKCQMISKPIPSPRSNFNFKKEASLPPVQSSGSSTWYIDLEPSQYQTESEEVQEYDQHKKSASPVPLPRTKSKKEIYPESPNGESSPVSVHQQSSLSPKNSGSNKFSVPHSEGLASVRTPPPRPTPPTAENVQRARKKITPDTEFTFENLYFNFGPTSGDRKFSDGQELHMRTGTVVSCNKQPIVKRKVNAEDRLSSEYITAELKLLDAELKKLEKEGRTLEDKIRSGTDESMDDDDKNDLMTHWFEMVNRKNDLVRQESDLIYRCRQQELEDKHEEVEFELRCLMNKPDTLKTASEKKKEEMLLQKLLQTVSLRNSIIESIEEDRIRYLKEDEEIAQMLNSSCRF